MYTISQIAKKFSLSRSTLIYYDSIGILSPSARNNSNYRLYSDSDVRRMEKVVMFRSTGLSLGAISLLLDKEGDELDTALENRLRSIHIEIQSLREQQNFILRILGKDNRTCNMRNITKEVWVSLLEAAGLNEAGMKKWHVEFERTSPEAHQDFLVSIGVEQKEIFEIRQWSRENASNT